MKTKTSKGSVSTERQALFTLCRFLAFRLSYRFMILLLAITGIFLSFTRQTQFAPYGISLLCLLLPSFLSNTADKYAKKESSDAPLSFLYGRYHYSLSALFCYRFSLLGCSLLLLFWHLLQNPVLSFCGLSLPLLYLVFSFAVPILLSRILFWYFHKRLMEGTL